MFGHSFHQGVYHFKLQVVTISTWTVAVKDGLDSMNPRRIEFALEGIEPDSQPSCTIDDQVLSVNCLKKLSSEILFLYFHEKNLLIGFLVQPEGHRSDSGNRIFLQDGSDADPAEIKS